MTEQQTEQLEERDSNVIEDLTLADAKTESVKGGGAATYLLQLGDVKGESNDRKFDWLVHQDRVL